jgi:hypothetical protein
MSDIRCLITNRKKFKISYIWRTILFGFPFKFEFIPKLKVKISIEFQMERDDPEKNLSDFILWLSDFLGSSDEVTAR